jgi:hypothetical protein
MATTKKPKRTPISGSRNILNVEGGDTSKFHYRIVNDTGDRVAMFQGYGYEIVTDDGVTVGSRRVANPTKEGSPVMVSVGGGTKGYLMRQSLENYNEDQKTKQEYVDKTEAGIKRGAKKDSDYGDIRIDPK